MNPQVTLITSLVALLLPAVSMAQNEAEYTLHLSFAQRHDIDFDTATYTTGASAKTVYGLIKCDYGIETGRTRIDTFDNVFGTTSVRDAEWDGYAATRMQCGYGIKLPIAGGELSAGIGIMHHEGETDSAPGGKEIDLQAARLQAKYTMAGTTTRLKVEDSQYDFFYHNLGIVNYDSDTRGHLRQAELIGEWGPLYTEVEDLDADKEKTFSTPLFPAARFDYHQTNLSLGPAFSGTLGPLRHIAPTYVTGSERGAFNELRLDGGIRGAILGMAFGEAKVRLAYLDLNSEGSRDYTPVTSTPMAEKRHSRSLSVELEADAWSASVQNTVSTHHGYITLDNPYAVLVACTSPPCSYDNQRDEDEWKLKLKYRYSKQFTLQGEFYQRKRKDRQYELAPAEYSEGGGNLGVNITF